MSEMTLPSREPDGEFPTFVHWVNKATSWIGGTNALCVDAKDRVCHNGGDMMRARDEDAFPVRFYHGEGGQSVSEQARNARLARRKRWGA
jgi:hypothetical protein